MSRGEAKVDGQWCLISTAVSATFSQFYLLVLSLHNSKIPGLSTIKIFHDRRAKANGDNLGKYGVARYELFFSICVFAHDRVSRAVNSSH